MILFVASPQVPDSKTHCFLFEDSQDLYAVHPTRVAIKAYCLNQVSMIVEWDPLLLIMCVPRTRKIQIQSESLKAIYIKFPYSIGDSKHILNN